MILLVVFSRRLLALLGIRRIAFEVVGAITDRIGQSLAERKFFEGGGGTVP